MWGKDCFALMGISKESPPFHTCAWGGSSAEAKDVYGSDSCLICRSRWKDDLENWRQLWLDTVAAGTQPVDLTRSSVEGTEMFKRKRVLKVQRGTFLLWICLLSVCMIRSNLPAGKWSVGLHVLYVFEAQGLNKSVCQMQPVLCPTVSVRET